MKRASPLPKIKSHELLCAGKNISVPGPVSGRLRVLMKPALQKVQRGDIAYLPSGVYDPENILQIYGLYKRGVIGIIIHDGGKTSHGAIVAKELGIPLIIEAGDIGTAVQDGQEILLQGDGVYDGLLLPQRGPLQTSPKSIPETRFKIMVHLGFPEVIDRRPSILDLADGVGFMRAEFVWLGILEGLHPLAFIEEKSPESAANSFADLIRPVVESFASRGKPVWMRTDDFSPSQLIRFRGGPARETHEANPMLGWRGIRRSLHQKELADVQFRALRILASEGYDNLGVFPPMAKDAREYREWKALGRTAGLDARKVRFGLMVEVPSAALTLEDFFRAGASFVVIGMNDLVQFTLALDRANERLAADFDEFHPGVLRMMEIVLTSCRTFGQESYLGGEAASNPKAIKVFREMGVTGVTISPDQQTLLRTKRLIRRLEGGRG